MSGFPCSITDEQYASIEPCGSAQRLADVKLGMQRISYILDGFLPKKANGGIDSKNHGGVNERSSRLPTPSHFARLY